METIKERFAAELLASPVDDRNIRRLLRDLQPDGTWPGIDYDDVSRTGFEHRRHLENLRRLARAYNHPHSDHFGEPDVKEAIHDALDYWIEHDFIADNWWWNEMGTPDRILDVLLLMEDELTETQRQEGARIASRANLEGVGARPGGDLIQIAGKMGRRALVENDIDLLEKAVEVMAGEVTIGTGRGLQPDLSLQHRHDGVTSTLTYGRGYASAFARYAVKLRGTRFRFPEEATRLLIDYYLEGIHRSMAHGKYLDPSQLNRGITRRSALRPRGPQTPERLAKASSYRRDELSEIVAVRRGERDPRFTFNKFFWRSEYLTHQRPDFFVSVRMYSSRNHNMERPYNGEGLKNHHLADGSHFIIRTGREYRGIFPVYDWQKIPGTTVVQKDSLPPPGQIQQPGQTDFVGGVSDGTYGAAAFDFVSPHDPLEARKGWFFFDEAFIALGAGIEAGTDRHVATTLNQALLHGDVIIRDTQGQRPLTPGRHRLEEASWVWHDGLAYFFPEPTAARLRNDSATGSWRDINRQSWADDTPIDKEVFKLWLDHGAGPKDASYAYAVVPGIDADRIKEHAPFRSLLILSNTPELQAVHHRGENHTQIAFYEAGEIRIADNLHVAVDKPCMLMIKAAPSGIKELAVADPARVHDSVQIRVSEAFTGRGERWTANPDPDTNGSLLEIDLPDSPYAGKSVVIEP